MHLTARPVIECHNTPPHLKLERSVCRCGLEKALGMRVELRMASEFVGRPAKLLRIEGNEDRGLSGKNGGKEKSAVDEMTVRLIMRVYWTE